MTTSAREVAFGVVRRVVENGAYSSRVVPAALARSGLDARDRAFATDLAYGTLRRRLPLDRAIARHANRPVRRISPAALAALRLGAYQLMFTGTPPHAALAETVGLVPARERGFVNAVLRKIAVDPGLPPEGDAAADVSGRTGLSEWAVAELRRVVGAAAPAAAAALAEPADLSLRANTCEGSVEELEAELAADGRSFRRSKLDPNCVLLPGGDPASLPGFARGLFAIQDEASAFVVRALAPGPGDRVLDACAAPGGKAAYASCLVGETGQVVAADVSPDRARLILAGSHRLGARQLVIAADATAPAVRGPFDRVLVDAPCSGIGSARRRPELLWRPRRDELSRLARAQVAIAVASADLRAARRTVRLFGVHVPAGRDRRGVRRARAPAARSGTDRDRRAGREGRPGSHLAASPWCRRHVRCGLYAAKVRAIRAGTIRRVGKLSASILSADLAYLADQVKLVRDHAEVIHVDIMDGHFVPPIALGTVVVASLRPHTDRMLHGHLMVDAPAAFFDELAEAGLDRVSFHHEAVDDPRAVVAKAEASGSECRGHVQPRDVGRIGVRIPRRDRRPHAHEHPSRLVGPDAGSPDLPATRGGARRGRPTGCRRRHRDRRRGEDRERPAAIDAGATVLVSASGIFQQPDPALAAARLAEIARGRVAA